MPTQALQQLYDGPGVARALFHESADALFLVEPETGQLLDVNAVALRLSGFERAELMQFPSTYLFRFPGQGGKDRLRSTQYLAPACQAEDARPDHRPGRPRAARDVSAAQAA